MTYQVIKTVNGHRYRYLQTSYRLGDKVRTHSTYLGPVDAALRQPSAKQATTSTPPEPILTIPAPLYSSTPILTACLSCNPENSPPNPAPTASPPVPSLPSLPPAFHSEIDLRRYNISLSRLQRQDAHFRTQLQAIGFDTTKFPSFLLKHSAKGFSCRFQPRQNRILLTIPRRHRKGDRTRLEHEITRAYALIRLEATSRQHPAVFRHLSLHFRPLFRTSQKLLAQLLRLDHRTDPTARILALRFFRNLPAGSLPFTTPERFGLDPFHRRRSWQDEAASLYAFALNCKTFASGLVRERKRARNAVFALSLRVQLLHPLAFARRALLMRQRKSARLRYEFLNHRLRTLQLVRDTLL